MSFTIFSKNFLRATNLTCSGKSGLISLAFPALLLTNLMKLLRNLLNTVKNTHVFMISYFMILHQN